MLPIYDEIFQQDDIQHILVRHEQVPVTPPKVMRGRREGRRHAGHFRPGATNAVTPLQDALMDSVPLVCISGQVPTSLIGRTPSRNATPSASRAPCTKHNWLVKDVNQLASIIHEAFRIAQTGRPVRFSSIIPKDIQFATGTYTPPDAHKALKSYQPKVTGDARAIQAAVELMASARRPDHSIPAVAS